MLWLHLTLSVMTDDPEPKFLTSREVMALLRYSRPTTFFENVRRLGIPHVRINPRKILFPDAALKRWIELRSVGKTADSQKNSFAGSLACATRVLGVSALSPASSLEATGTATARQSISKLPSRGESDRKTRNEHADSRPRH